jgi:hypothetical protein
MQSLYFMLAAFHIVAVVLTGLLWTLLDLGFQSKLRPYLRDVRAVHFGSLYLVPWFLGLDYAFHLSGPHFTVDGCGLVIYGATG